MTTINRHKTAISRGNLSSPVARAVNDGIIHPEKTFFDYGCGKGDDIAYLKLNGFNASGWDPVHDSDNPIVTSDVVNLGFVLNVIENVNERRDTLRKAFELAQRVLIVSVMLDTDSNKPTRAVPHGDGLITSRGTFQKLYSQSDFKAYVTDVLEIEPVSAGLGALYIFKDCAEKQLFLATRVQSKSYVRRLITSIPLEEQYKDAKEVLTQLVAHTEELGRLPNEDEFDQANLLKAKLGSFHKASALIQHFFPDNIIAKRRQQRTDDLLVYLALTRFSGRPTMGELPEKLQMDMRAFFGSYTKACKQADELLFLSGDPNAIGKACNESKIGKILPADLYVHKQYINQLSPILRVYVGCAQVLVGEIEEANIIKIHKHSGKVSYLVYDNFDQDPHPALQETVIVMLRTLYIKTRLYRESSNPPILHRKETFVLPDYPNYDKFKSLTNSEEKKSLLPAQGIGFRDQWNAHVKKYGYEIRGHRVYKLKENIPMEEDA